MSSQQPEKIRFNGRNNSRSFPEHYITGQHVSLEKLKENPQKLMKKYILKSDIPPYPNPVEFWVSDVAHVTNKSGFEGILKSEEFRPPECEFSWWDLKITKEEINSAENLYVESEFPKEQVPDVQRPFLEKFTTSPLFQLEKSRYGNYRFTFPLMELMKLYKEQNCGGKEPVLRMHETIIYIQEIVYTVLIHSPEDNERFREYPLLVDSERVGYKDGRIIWKAQAICETHNNRFVSGKVEEITKESDKEYYVWDMVSLVFHLPKYTEKGLKIPRRRLIEALETCVLEEKVNLSRSSENVEEATLKVGELKRELEEKKKENETKEDDNIKNEVDP